MATSGESAIELERQSEDIIGRGSFGVVYKGRLAGRDVAVKVINRHWHEKYWNKLKNEAILLVKNLRHPNVIRILKYEDKYPQLPEVWIAMELCQESLESYLKNNSLDDPQILDVLWQCANGLFFLHRNNLVHRDIKADNILIKLETSSRIMKVTDFSLSKDIEGMEDESQSTTIHGNVHWLAPEMFNDEGSKAERVRFTGSSLQKIDVFSFALIILYICLTKDGRQDLCKKYKLGLDVKLGKDVLVYFSRQWSSDRLEQIITPLLQKMLSVNAEDRPSMEEVRNFFKSHVKPCLDPPKVTTTPHVEPPKVTTPRLKPPKLTIAPRVESPKVTTAPYLEFPKVITTPRVEPPKVTTAHRPEPPKLTIAPRLESPKVTTAPYLEFPKVTTTPRVELPIVSTAPNLVLQNSHHLGDGAHKFVGIGSSRHLILLGCKPDTLSPPTLCLLQLQRDGYKRELWRKACPEGAKYDNTKYLADDESLITRSGFNDPTRCWSRDLAPLHTHTLGIGRNLRAILPPHTHVYSERKDGGWQLVLFEGCISIERDQQGHTLRPPADTQWSADLSICRHPTSGCMAVVDWKTRTLIVFDRSGELQHCARLDYGPGKYDAITSTNSHLVVSEYETTILHFHMWDGKKVGSRYVREVAKLRDEEDRVHSVGVSEGDVLVVAVGSSLDVSSLHSMKVQ